MNRRRLLQSIASGSAISTGVGVGSARQSDSKNLLLDVEIEEYEGRSRRQVLSQFREDSRVQSLLDELRDRGWAPNWSRTDCSRIINSAVQGEWDIVIARFDGVGRGTADKQAVVGWIANSTVELELETNTFAHIVEEADEDEIGIESDTPTLLGYKGGTALIPDEEDVRTENMTFQDQVGTHDELPGGGGGSDDWCSVDICVVDHRLSDWGCAVSLIVSVTGLAISCPLCPLSGGATCIACLLAAGGFAALLGAGCLSEHDCDYTAREVPQGWVSEQTDGKKDCMDYHVSNDNAIVVESLADVPTRY